MADGSAHENPWTDNEAPRWLQLEAELGYVEFQMGELHRLLQGPKSAIEALVDDACYRDEVHALVARHEALSAELHALSEVSGDV